MEFRRKNIRLHPTRYRGRGSFFITLCCARRRCVFSDRKNALREIDHLKIMAEKYNFAIHAFCVMPDHFHALVEGTAADSDLLLFVSNFKRATSLEYSGGNGVPLWQKKFYDHILRPNDSPEGVAWYIWMNPVRKGLRSQPDQYPYSGSFTGQWEKKSQPKTEWIPTWKAHDLGARSNPAALAK